MFQVDFDAKPNGQTARAVVSMVSKNYILSVAVVESSVTIILGPNAR